MGISRRSFLQHSAAVSTAFAGLAALAACGRNAEAGYLSEVKGYGPLRPDPHGLFELPPGFSYTIVSETGDAMSDGLTVPGDPDGMAAFPGEDGFIRLVRNHELHPGEMDGSAFGPDAARAQAHHREWAYDETAQGRPHPGGTTTLVLDPQTLEVKRQFLSLAGTVNNCAGGPTPWGSWISCEETLMQAGRDARHDHGYAFEVPAAADALVEARPLRALGRFRREAAGVDPASGIVYQTEDDEPGLFTRFLPDFPGELHRGGRLQALAVRGRPGADLRNWPVSDEPVAPGTVLPVDWIDLENVGNPDNDLAARGVAAGAAWFTRGEGLWFATGELYFCCTDGGPQKRGQIWRYRPGQSDAAGTLELFVESTDARVLDKCDNITVAPWGDLIVAEDGRGEQFLRGITPQGRIYTIGRNAHSRLGGAYSEITGPCFSPDGTTLFFNVQKGPGRTFAVRGPWSRRSPVSA